MRTRAVLFMLLVAGCSSEDLTFPKGFLFGTAIAGFQVEMGCPTVKPEECEDRNSDWYQFITEPSLTGDARLSISGDPPTAGPGFYELYPQDLDRAANELHNNALRISIEWSRIFPTATDGVEGHDALRAIADPKALAFYHALLSAMKQRGIQPFVTINHYALPTWIDDVVACHQDIATCTHKGWVDEARITKEIAKYAGFLGAEFGGEVDRWATLNEPLTAVVLAGFIFPSAMRANPPGVFLKYDEAHTAIVSEIEAHARMYDAVHASDTVDADGDGVPAKVGIVYNLQAVAAADPTDPQDVQGTKNLDYLENQAFLDAVGKGDLDVKLDGNQVHRPDLEHRLDFIGINYYARTVAQGTPTSFFPQLSPLVTFNPLAVTPDYEYPKGVYEVMMFAKRYGVPLLISETGSDDQESGKAVPWLVDTLTWLKRAMRDGVPIEGYFYWTLMDNYEWNHGMSIRLGLYAVDKNDPTKARRARAAVAAYGRIAQEGRIPADLAEKYPAR